MGYPENGEGETGLYHEDIPEGWELFFVSQEQRAGYDATVRSFKSAQAGYRRAFEAQRRWRENENPRDWYLRAGL